MKLNLTRTFKNPNADIRRAIAEAGITQWQVAKRLHLQDTNFSRLLRDDLSEDKKKIIFDAIEELKDEQENKDE